MSTTNFEPDQPVRITQGLVGTSAAGATVNVSDATDPDGDIDAHSLVFSGASVSEGDDGEALIDLSPGIKTLRNGSGSDVTAFMVVVNDETTDDTFITTTTAQFTDGAVGVAQAAIAAGESGPILFNGYTPVQVTAAVTRGDFLETSATAGMATTNPTRREGSFGVLLTGADPADTVLDGLSDMVIDTLTTVLTTNGTSLTVNVPATRPDGMLMFMALWFSGAVTGLTATGWTLIGTPAGNQYYYQRVSASEPATYSVSWTNSVQCVAGIVILDGLDTASPVAGSNYENTSAAAAITGLASNYYLAIAGVKGVTPVATTWTYLLADTSASGGAGSPAAIVQSVSTRSNSSSELRTVLPAAVTPGNLLVMALSKRQGGSTRPSAILNAAYLTGLHPTRPFTNFGPTVEVEVGSVYGSDAAAIGYRIATGDEQDLKWGAVSTLTNATLYEISNAGLASGFEVRSQTNHAAGTTKTLGAFGTAGDLQIGIWEWESAATDQTAGTGYTQNYQANHNWPANGTPAMLTQNSVTGAEPQITGTSHKWAGVAVGITSGTLAVSGQLVAELFQGTGVTSPFSGASLATDAVIALALAQDPFVSPPIPTAIIWNGTDLDAAGGGLIEDMATAETDATLVLAPDGVGGVEFRAETSGSADALLRLGGEQAAVHTESASGTALTVDLSVANTYDITLTGNCTFTFSNPAPAGVDGSWTFVLRQDGTGSRTVTWPAAVKWISSTGTTAGSAPTLYTAANAIDVITITTLDGGTTYGGSRETQVPAFATPSVVLGTSAVAGSAGTVIRSDSTIAAFDATVPVTQAFSDAAATGSAAFAARRDHRHGMPATPTSGGIGEILISDTPSTPLIFADLIQNEAQDDLVYADP